ncbi:MAG TPA: DUF5719 family protein [Acidimicrobiales bacterium]|nr:DUF5719 family protein [Acidimicrobiales bacterium]
MAAVPVAVALAGATTASAVLDGPAPGRGGVTRPAVPGAVQVARADVADGAWYCAGATASTSGNASGSVSITNASPRVVSGDIRVVTDNHSTGATAVTVPPWGRVVVAESSVATGGFAGATVSLNSGLVAVEQITSGPLGASVTPCTSRPSTAWYFASGDTRQGAALVLVMYNPFAEDALADVVFATNQGQVAPPDFQGLFVAAHSVVALDVAKNVIDVPLAAASVHVRSGRLVADELSEWAGAGHGVTLQPGAPSPASSWYVPYGVTGPGLEERYRILNPTGRPTTATVALALAAGQAEPMVLRIPPGSVANVTTSLETRVPAGDVHAVTVTASPEPVVVERSFNAYPPATESGFSVVRASPVAARRWLLGAGAGVGVAEAVTVFDPGRGPARIQLWMLTPAGPQPVAAVVAAPGTATQIVLPSAVSDGAPALMVTADRPVVAERDLSAQSALTSSMGVPLP